MDNKQNKCNKMLDYIKIVDRLRMVSWCSNSHQIDVDKPGLRVPYLPTNLKSCVSTRNSLYRDSF